MSGLEAQQQYFEALPSQVSQDIVPQALINHFVSMTNPSQAQNTDNEIAHHCAFSLPAVALTLGRKNWILLKNAYDRLASDMQVIILRTICVRSRLPDMGRWYIRSIKMSVETRQFITYNTILGRRVLTLFESSSGPPRNRSKVVKVYIEFWDPKCLTLWHRNFFLILAHPVYKM